MGEDLEPTSGEPEEHNPATPEVSGPERGTRPLWHPAVRVVAFGLIATGGVVAFVVGIAVLYAVLASPLHLPAPSEDSLSQPGVLLILIALSYLPVFGVLLVFARCVDRRPLTNFGLLLNDKTLKGLGIGAALGLAGAGLLFLASLCCGWIHVRGFAWMDRGSLTAALLPTVGFLLGFYVPSFGEEVVFRGYFLQNLTQVWGAGIATILTSVVFSLVHVGNPGISPLAILNIALIGVWLSCLYFLTGSLWTSIGYHFAWNSSLALFYSLPVSGIPFPTLLSLQTGAGPSFWTGGQFGPEGGMMCTILEIVLLAGTARLLVKKRRRETATLTNNTQTLEEIG